MTLHPVASHPVLLGAPRDMSGGGRPALLQRSDEDFIASTLDDLRSAGGRQALDALRAQATASDGALKLFHPVQRQFHLALIESWCDAPGAPRLDPARVISAGMVLRRIAGSARQGWMRSNGRVRGWVPLNRVGGDLADPLAAPRLQRTLTGVADIDRKLAGFALENADNRLDEHIISLYLAPPDVCADAAKTVFYGIVPTASSELSEAEPEFLPPGDDSFGPQSDAFLGHLPDALRGLGMRFPHAGETLTTAWLDESGDMQTFIQLLHQLGSEFDAFDGGDAVADLKSRLQAIRLPLVWREDDTVQRTVDAYTFLSQASALLLTRESVSAPEMPESWPAMETADSAALAQSLHSVMLARFKATKGREGRFDAPDARYVIRAFVRLKCPNGGPARIVWSDESPAFAIAPWYEGAGAPPVQIPLPDASDKNLLKALKPNVAFVVPPAMQGLLGGKAKDLMSGSGGFGVQGLSWICSFNIPVITICAFIVLNIFLSLFNLIFGWMFFIKICLPFPKLGNKPPPSP
ncbi:MAG: hypothetical protein M0Z73_07610 [Betaproteobacteria bacterium]|nr:hypothetical protein [Betaproteobacteria bacterium]